MKMKFTILSLFLFFMFSVSGSWAQTSNYFNGFESSVGAGDWENVVIQADGTNGVPASSGAAYGSDVLGKFTRFGGYNSTFPSFGYSTSLDVYLDVDGGYSNDSRFDYTSAISAPGGNHRRDFIFHGGFYNDATAVGTPNTNRFIFSVSNNAPGWPANPGRSPIAISTSGWYTLEHQFYDSGSGVLAVDLNIYDSAGLLVGSWTLSNPTDIIGSTVGGNRYGWFPYNDLADLAIDNSELLISAMPPVQNLTQNTFHSTIQGAVDNANPGDVIEASDGTYNENVLIDKSLTLQSANGPGTTSIVGSDVALGTITLPNGSSSITIDGFTIEGFDGASPGLEKAAIYMQGAQNDITIINNEVVADGEAALLSEFNAAIDNIFIDNNIFSGQTFTGSVPGGCGFGSQFTTPNVPRQLVTMGGGSGVSNSMNVTFTNNTVSGAAGAPKPGCNPPYDYQGNTLVTLDIIDVTITGNTFSGATGRFATQLRVRGTNTTLESNVFDGNNLGPVAGYVFADADAFDGSSTGSLEGAQSANSFSPSSFISGSTIFPCTLAGDGPLPGDWSQADIGASSSGSSYSYNPCSGTEGEFQISTSAYNPASGSTDELAFAYQTLCGDGMITAKIEDVSSFGYAGLMMRENTAAGAKQSSIFSNLTNVLRLESRTVTNGPKSVQAFYRPFPFWLRLQRQGALVISYYSTDGVSFQPITYTVLSSGDCLEVGLAVFGAFPTPVEATFSNVSITSINNSLVSDTDLPVRWETANEVQAPVTANVFPNPAQDVVQLAFNTDLPVETTVVLRNQLGQVVRQRQFQAGSANSQWDISQFSPGVYYFEIRQGQQSSQTLKVVKSE